MAKRLVLFGESPTDKLVREWLDIKMIDSADVLGYKITRGNNVTPTIELTLFYGEESATGAEKEIGNG
jgi:hypothetical protein